MTRRSRSALAVVSTDKRGHTRVDRHVVWASARRRGRRSGASDGAGIAAVQTHARAGAGRTQRRDEPRPAGAVRQRNGRPDQAVPLRVNASPTSTCKIAVHTHLTHKKQLNGRGSIPTWWPTRPTRACSPSRPARVPRAQHKPPRQHRTARDRRPPGTVTASAHTLIASSRASLYGVVCHCSSSVSARCTARQCSTLTRPSASSAGRVCSVPARRAPWMAASASASESESESARKAQGEGGREAQGGEGGREAQGGRVGGKPGLARR